MKIAVARETRDGEARVAMVPELVEKLTGLGYDVAVEPEAGRHALLSDEEYAEAGASIDDAAFDGADLVVSVQPLDPPTRPRPGAAGTSTISFFPTNAEAELVATYRDAEITSYAMELVPRISRAQSMDALSSQALVAGYRCAVVAAGMLRRFFPLNMTAAGTVQPATVVVLGAGVAGLQAIATAKRLGAVVQAYDVRAAAAEEIASMGAKPITLELETLEGSGGYAREMTEDRAARQRELLTPYIATADALITTAAVPGRRGADAGHDRDGRADEPRLGRGRPGGRDRRQRRGLGRRRGRPDRQRPGLGRAQRAQPDARPGVAPLRAEHRQPGDPDDRRGRRGRRRRSHPTPTTRSSPVRASPATARSSTNPPGRRWREKPLMSEPIIWLTIFILSVFVGIEVISKVSSTLHTPLMSGANAIHGVILLGAIIVTAHASGVALVVGLVAIVLAAVNMVGGFVVTDRMLQMFTRKKTPKKGGGRVIPTWAQLVYLLCAVAFILALKGLSGPRTARAGNLVGAGAAVVACALPFFYMDAWTTCALILVAIAVGTAGGVYGAQKVQMTQMPQMVALFNGVGGGAAALVALLELEVIVDAARVTPSAGSCWSPPRSRSSSARCRSPARSSPSPSSRT